MTIRQKKTKERKKENETKCAVLVSDGGYKKGLDGPVVVLL